MADVRTVKRLFAVSGNLCAFPNCKCTLVDQQSGKIIGQICHIKGKRIGAKRHDPRQSDDEREGFDNLILLCANHHAVIDDDEIAYTVERLCKMKIDHQKKMDGSGVDLTTEAAQWLINVQNNSVTNGSIIISNNQSGGQVAHAIVNLGPQPRVLTQQAGDKIVADLKRSQPHRFEVEHNSSDGDGALLANSFAGMLQEGGWTCTSFVSSQVPAPQFGITISYAERTEAVVALVNGLRNAGFRPIEAHLPAMKLIHILVGYPERH